MIEFLKELRQSLTFPKKAMGSVVLSLAPGLVHLALNFSGLGSVMNSIAVLSFVVGAAGMVSGYTFGFISVLAGPISSAVIVWLAIQLHFAGHGGDGDMYFVIQVGSAIWFMVTSFSSALVAALNPQ